MTNMIYCKQFGTIWSFGRLKLYTSTPLSLPHTKVSGVDRRVSMGPATQNGESSERAADQIGDLTIFAREFFAKLPKASFQNGHFVSDQNGKFKFQKVIFPPGGWIIETLIIPPGRWKMVGTCWKLWIYVVLSGKRAISSFFFMFVHQKGSQKTNMGKFHDQTDPWKWW